VASTKADNPYDALEALLLQEPSAFELVLAERSTRFAAWATDVFTLLLATSPWLVMVLDVPGIPQMPEGFTEANAVAVSSALLVLVLAVNALLMHLRGQTIGKALFRIRMVRSDGARAGLARLLFARYLVPVVLNFVPVAGMFVFPVDALMIFGGAKRCLHDLIADTLVVKA
jgi:uncharacterized RDD family membrane protein YckC